MFNFLKKRARQDALIAAVREMMAKSPPGQELRMMSPGALEHKFIKKYLSIGEAEKENMVNDPRLGDSPVPFGFSNSEWRELLAEMQHGDELWTFSTSDESWDNLAGRAGISLVRNGKEVSCIVTKMN
jgi:hypothetical protein